MNPMLNEPLQNLIDLARDPSADEEALREAAQEFLNAASQAKPKEANAALATLAGHIGLDDLAKAAFLALVCGALVEEGRDPSPMIEPLNQRLQYLLESAAELADACRARLPQAQEDDQDNDEEFERVLEEVAGEMPLESDAWQALNQFWRPAIAVFSISEQARAAARHLRELAGNIAEFHEGGHWLRLMLSVLDNDPILAIEPDTGVGMLARITGVVDNFQLNVLLMDGFPGKGARRVSKRVAEVARGIGPQQTDDNVTGAWNLYTWGAVKPGLKLADPGKDEKYWIWNEGVPDDIPVFEGRRVILLGPPTYSRTWRSQRMFDKLPAKLECERVLSEAEVDDWLQRMLSAMRNR